MNDALFTFLFSVCFGYWAVIKLGEAYLETTWKRRSIALFWAVSAAMASITLLVRVQ